ncbi:hypothetical protein GCM10010377_74130 [Streptomyces viridiviolaceus]|uniref:Uncharacterized protein n=1 Tax=Streptomyces viridiviolaceus TaxID=68282 RepID=A0ABW2E176_9ACTN|nr:hypothetical protein [Streptomyces viridiviolaceus]GHB72805.1 hypothetical protein GCM10010377_74130 [Streptomyces viridiviolaceus]
MGEPTTPTAIGADTGQVVFHLFAASEREETGAARDVLSRAGIGYADLRPPGANAPGDDVLTGTATVAALADAVAALRHRFRYGIAVRLAGPTDVVVRSDPRVEHGQIVIRKPRRDVPVRDTRALRSALNGLLAQGAPDPVPLPHPPSIMFRDHQSAELAAEATRLARVLTDPDFVSGADPTGTLLDNPEMLADVSGRPRTLLDLLLLAHAFSRTDDGDHRVRDLRVPDLDEVRRLASTVEVFVQPSTEPESRVLARPLADGRQGFVIGLPPQTGELMANISWALPSLFAFAEGMASDSAGPDSFTSERDRTWADVDVTVASYLRSWRPPRAAALIPPRPLIPMTMPQDASRHGPGDPYLVFDACTLFLIARELSPILQGRYSDRAEPPLVPFTAGLPRDVRLETQADCAAYVHTMNALILGAGKDGPFVPDFDNIRRHFHHGRPSRFGRTRRLEEQARHEAAVVLACVHRTTEAVLSYYAVVDLFAALARVRRDGALARRLEAIGDRREAVCRYMLWVKEHGLPEAWGLRTRLVGEEDGWERVWEYVRHAQRHLVPTLVGPPG